MVKIDNAKHFKLLPYRPEDSNAINVIKHNCRVYFLKKKKPPKGLCVGKKFVKMYEKMKK